MFSDIKDKSEMKIWHPIVDTLNKLNDKLLDFSDNYLKNDFGKKMFAAV